MKKFRTEIIETKDLNLSIKLITIGFFLTANYLWVINAFNQYPVLKYIFWTFCFTGFLLFLAVPFIKPKKIGRLEIGPDGIEFGCKESEVKITLPQIKELNFKCEGFRRWWNRAAYGNRNYLIMKTNGDDYFEFEILVKNREHKKVLNSILAAHKNKHLTSFAYEKEAYAG